MPPQFDPIDIDRIDEYNDVLATCPEITSDYAFANIWGWAEQYGLQWAFVKNRVWIKQTIPHEVYWAPVGPWDQQWLGCKCFDVARNFTRVPEALARIWRDTFGQDMEITACRDHWDYVYSASELIELTDPRLKDKKNLLETFKTNYLFEYSPMTADCIEEVLAMQEQWVTWQEDDKIPVLKAENSAIRRVLHDFDRINCLKGGAIRVDGRVVAYTVAECLRDGTMVIHFEKGDTRFEGVYQAINQMFLADAADGDVDVNREQDLGDPGLRKAKLSYMPKEFHKKYEAVLK